MFGNKKTKWSKQVGSRFVFLAALMAGCSSPGYGIHNKSTAGPSQEAVVPAPKAAPGSTDAAPSPMPAGSSTAGSSKGVPANPPYAVAISTDRPLMQTVGVTDGTAFLVHNTGPDIPALSLQFEGINNQWTVLGVSSDLGTHPAEVRVENGRGWDFGPLPHGASAHILLKLSPRGPGKHPLVIRPFAVAEDEGDSLLSIDSHIPGGDKELTVVVRPSSSPVRI